MPLTDLQQSALNILRSFRNEQSFVGGGAALNQNWARISDDLDIFGYADEEIRTVRMVGENVSREIVREVLEPALDQASAYCRDSAPPAHLGQLFVNAGKIPVEATEAILASGDAIAKSIRNFGVTSRFVRG